MKDPRVIIGSILILALGALLFAERQSNQQLERQIAQLKQDAEARVADAASAQEDLGKLRQKLEDGKQVIAQLEARGKEVASSGAGDKSSADAAAGGDGADAKKAGGDFGTMVRKMFSDPKMKRAS